MQQHVAWKPSSDSVWRAGELAGVHYAQSGTKPITIYAWLKAAEKREALTHG